MAEIQQVVEEKVVVSKGSFEWKTDNFMNKTIGYRKSPEFIFGRYNCCLFIPTCFKGFSIDGVRKVDLITVNCLVDAPMFNQKTVYTLSLIDRFGKEFISSKGTVRRENKIIMMVLFIEYLKKYQDELLSDGDILTFRLSWNPWDEAPGYSETRTLAVSQQGTQTTPDLKTGHKMETVREVTQNSFLIENLSIVCFLLLFAGSVALLNNNKSRPLLKFCFNSRDQFVAAQCVLCDFYQFSATVLGCNGRTSALMSNITSTEAVCIISNCLQQVRQAQPQFTGRKKRESSVDTPEVETETLTEVDFERQEFFDEKKELSAVAPSVKELLNRYIMMDKQFLKELEEQVVDKIEVMVDAEDEDYEE